MKVLFFVALDWLNGYFEETHSCHRDKPCRITFNGLKDKIPITLIELLCIMCYNFPLRWVLRIIRPFSVSPVWFNCCIMLKNSFCTPTDIINCWNVRCIENNVSSMDDTAVSHRIVNTNKVAVKAIPNK